MNGYAALGIAWCVGAALLFAVLAWIGLRNPYVYNENIKKD